MESLTLIRHTPNYEAVLEFFRDYFELETVESWDEPGNRGTVLRFPPPLGKLSLEVLDLKGVPRREPVTRALDISIYVESAVQWHDRLVAAGVPIARGIEDAPWGLRSFGIDDPDGLRIWFQERLGPKTSGLE
jgi:catechol 2,3-dioxygenase-like lactoylglutathione lyase family enzyme